MLNYIKHHPIIIFLILLVWGVTIFITQNKPVTKKPKADTLHVDSVIQEFDKITIKEKQKIKKDSLEKVRLILLRKNDSLEKARLENIRALQIKQIKKDSLEKVNLKKEKELAEQEREQEKRESRRKNDEIEMERREKFLIKRKYEELDNMYKRVDTSSLR